MSRWLRSLLRLIVHLLLLRLLRLLRLLLLRMLLLLLELIRSLILLLLHGLRLHRLAANKERVGAVHVLGRMVHVLLRLLGDLVQTGGRNDRGRACVGVIAEGILALIRALSLELHSVHREGLVRGCLEERVIALLHLGYGCGVGPAIVVDGVGKLVVLRHGRGHRLLVKGLGWRLGCR